MILHINTQDKNLISVTLRQEKKEVATLSEENQYGSQVLLPLINKILENNKLTFKDLTAIEVNTGPGSFVGLRVGVSVANALGFSLNIPVNGKKIETELTY